MKAETCAKVVLALMILICAGCKQHGQASAAASSGPESTTTSASGPSTSAVNPPAAAKAPDKQKAETEKQQPSDQGNAGERSEQDSVKPQPVPATPAVQRLRVSSGVLEGNLVNKVEPQYPQMAKIAHVQGYVVLQSLISKQGTVENLRAISGHPILLQAAMDAVRQWRYRPYILNGQPVEVESTITVRFHM